MQRSTQQKHWIKSDRIDQKFTFYLFGSDQNCWAPVLGSVDWDMTQGKNGKLDMKYVACSTYK